MDDVDPIGCEIRNLRAVWRPIETATVGEPTLLCAICVHDENLAWAASHTPFKSDPRGLRGDGGVSCAARQAQKRWQERQHHEGYPHTAHNRSLSSTSQEPLKSPTMWSGFRPTSEARRQLVSLSNVWLSRLCKGRYACAGTVPVAPGLTTPATYACAAAQPTSCPPRSCCSVGAQARCRWCGPSRRVLGPSPHPERSDRHTVSSERARPPRSE
jgi:hypothetical protein